MVQELRLEHRRGTFIDELARVVTALGTIPDTEPVHLTVADRDRLREIADEIVAAIEHRIDTDQDAEPVKQHLASTIYEIRRRMEVVETWFSHDFPGV
jgi:hypothetical protein